MVNQISMYQPRRKVCCSMVYNTKIIPNFILWIPQIIDTRSDFLLHFYWNGPNALHINTKIYLNKSTWLSGKVHVKESKWLLAQNFISVYICINIHYWGLHILICTIWVTWYVPLVELLEMSIKAAIRLLVDSFNIRPGKANYSLFPCAKRSNMFLIT